jgi:hypothetical protein
LCKKTSILIFISLLGTNKSTKTDFDERKKRSENKKLNGYPLNFIISSKKDRIMMRCVRVDCLHSAFNKTYSLEVSRFR